ncbi:MAG: 5'/3'-nucleotidase SurE [Peptococcaceae bacterium]|nr:5'/3'-nucleotidase SurE [Peptococcaceae bacterium]
MANILLVNDDGIDSPGIRSLILELKGLGQIWVAAPSAQRSAASHGITVRRGMAVRQVPVEGTKCAWSIGGKPADCIKMAVVQLLNEPMDLLISGINEGPNLGTDTLYSGTVAGAVEGAFNDIPAMAVSLVREKAPWDFGAAAKITAELAGRYLSGQLHIPPMSILNVNVPDLPREKLQGLRATRLGIRKYSDYYHLLEETPEEKVYHLRGSAIPGDGIDLDEDANAVAKGYVSISPISVDRTDYQLLAELRQKL